MAVTGLDKVFVVNAETNTKYGGVDPTGEFVTINDLVPQPYKVYTALLTQEGIGGTVDWRSGDGSVPVGVTFEILGNDAGSADFTNIGAPNNNQGTFFMSTGGIPNSWGNALKGVLQYNTGAPVATVLENTIGNIWFTYGDVGNYSVNSNNLFIESKSMAIIGTPAETVSNNNFAGIVPAGPSVFIIDVVELGPINDMLNNTPIEIRVYN